MNYLCDYSSCWYNSDWRERERVRRRQLLLRLVQYYYHTAFISHHVSHQFGNAKAHINKHTQDKSITKIKINN